MNLSRDRLCDAALPAVAVSIMSAVEELDLLAVGGDPSSGDDEDRAMTLGYFLCGDDSGMQCTSACAPPGTYNKP